MTEDKKFKRIVRARMAETGETYAQARTAIDAPEAAASKSTPSSSEETAREEMHALFAEAFAASRERERERKRTWPLTPTGDLDMRAAMSKLARLFPTLEDADGLRPWDAESFVTWAVTSGSPGSGAMHAVRFVLQVWNFDEDWNAFAKHATGRDVENIGPFNVVAAIANWDRAHREAMMTWLRVPFHP